MEEVELLPFQGAITWSLVPRAMPWAKCLLAFQAVSTQGFHNLRNLNFLYLSPIQRYRRCSLFFVLFPAISSLPLLPCPVLLHRPLSSYPAISSLPFQSSQTTLSTVLYFEDTRQYSYPQLLFSLSRRLNHTFKSIF